MSPLRIFRFLLVAQPLLLLGALGLTVFVSEPMSNAGGEFPSAQEQDALGDLFDWIESHGGPAALIGFVLSILAAYFVSLIGLYQCRRWGRTLFVIGLLGSLAIESLASGAGVGPLEATLDTLMITIDGAILALAFVGPVAEKINASTSDKSESRLQSYVWFRRSAFALAIGGIVAILLGILCLPKGLVNPKSFSSSFSVFGAAGSFVDVARLLFVTGGGLVLASVVLWVSIRVTFRERRG